MAANTNKPEIIDKPEIPDEKLIRIFGLVITVTNILISFKSIPEIVALLESLQKPAHQNDMVGAGPGIFFLIISLAIHSTLPCALLGIFYNKSTANNSVYLTICAVVIVLVTLAPVLIIMVAGFLSDGSSIHFSGFGIGVGIAIFGLIYVVVNRNKEIYKTKIEKTLLHYNSFGLIVLFLFFFFLFLV